MLFLYTPKKSSQSSHSYTESLTQYIVREWLPIVTYSRNDLDISALGIGSIVVTTDSQKVVTSD